MNLTQIILAIYLITCSTISLKFANFIVWDYHIKYKKSRGRIPTSPPNSDLIGAGILFALLSPIIPALIPAWIFRKKIFSPPKEIIEIRAKELEEKRDIEREKNMWRLEQEIRELELINQKMELENRTKK